MEEWRAVVGYEGRYEVSSLGRVRALKRIVVRRGHNLTMPARIMKISPHCKTGYNLVRLSKGGKESKLLRVNRLVCAAFHGPANGLFAAHRNGNNQDDRADNLSWLTRAENEADKLIHGTRPMGVTAWNAQLAEDQVREIRKLRKAGETYRAISSRMNVKFEAVRGVIARGHYADIRECA